MRAGNDYESAFWEKQQFVMGIDEAGRGPIAGPLVVCGVVLPIGFDYDGIYDSKAISKKKREQLYEVILDQAVAYCIQIKDAAFVDRFNIYQATRMAMEECVAYSSVALGAVLTDAMPLRQSAATVIPLIKGDQKSISIAAASIIAKVTRDRIMEAYDQLYPQYGFARHVGYPTKEHLEKLREYGCLPIHRQSYGPVAELNQLTLF